MKIFFVGKELDQSFPSCNPLHLGLKGCLHNNTRRVSEMCVSKVK